MNKSLIIKRHPKSANKSLRPFNAADELLLNYCNENSLRKGSILLFNDRFGFLACQLSNFAPISVVHYKSEEKALRQNLMYNNFTIIEENMITPLVKVPEIINLTLIKVPKSLDLFRMQLYSVAQNMDKSAIVVCGFMTRFFSKKMIEIAEYFFEEVTQSLAKKKARLLILKKKKAFKIIKTINEVKLDNNTVLQQYNGVFSSGHIDYASLFFIEHLKIENTQNCILDLASGNGVLAYAARQQNTKAEIHLVDDSFLAIESSKLNITDANTHFHFSDNLENFPSDFFDLVLSNPPFHFEYETNIEVALNLFKAVKKCLKTDGHFKLVCSQHLNFKTHLSKLFKKITVLAENDKTIIYDCYEKTS